MMVVDTLTDIIKSLGNVHDVNLMALIKKNSVIHPIAVGYTLRCLAARCFCSLLQEQSANCFLLTQFGVAVPGAAEAIINWLCLIWENN